MISIRRSDVYKLWTIYVFGKGIAGLTRPRGFFVGGFIVVYHPKFRNRFHLGAMYKGKRLI